MIDLVTWLGIITTTALLFMLARPVGLTPRRRGR